VNKIESEEQIVSFEEVKLETGKALLVIRVAEEVLKQLLALVTLTV
jgi:hypothetical protein